MGTISLLQYKPFEKLGNSSKFYLTIPAKEASGGHITFLHYPLSDLPSHGPPTEMADLLKEFTNVVPEEVPTKLPSLRDI